MTDPEQNTWEYDVDEVHASVDGVSWYATATMTGDIRWKRVYCDGRYTGRSSCEWRGEAIRPRLKSLSNTYNADTDQLEPLPANGFAAFAETAPHMIDLSRVKICPVVIY
jgi:hypothetical protein